MSCLGKSAHMDSPMEDESSSNGKEHEDHKDLTKGEHGGGGGGMHTFFHIVKSCLQSVNLTLSECLRT